MNKPKKISKRLQLYIDLVKATDNKTLLSQYCITQRDRSNYYKANPRIGPIHDQIVIEELTKRLTKLGFYE